MNVDNPNDLPRLRESIIACRKCPRLVEHRESVSREKRKAFIDWTYWGRPVPGFGDPGAQLVIIGLAPAAHGGNRTGRVFTGDPSASFLMRGLHEAGFANQPTSESRDDGLRLLNAYMTAAVRCAPPGNRPTSEEVRNCAPYLWRELDILHPKSLLVLGRLAFDAAMAYLGDRYGVRKKAATFRHGAVYRFSEEAPVLFVSYHPSPRNTQTGLLKRESFQDLLARVREDIEDRTPSR
ncbi:MAG: uracil-DNA glycosylase [Thermoplasmata archaeon]